MDSNSGHCISYSMPEQIGAIRMMILKERQIITYPGKAISIVQETVISHVLWLMYLRLTIQIRNAKALI